MTTPVKTPLKQSPGNDVGDVVSLWLGGAVCTDFSIDPFDLDPSNRKLELQLTSFRDRFRDL